MLKVFRVTTDCVGLFCGSILLAIGKLIMAAGVFLTLMSSYIVSNDKDIERPILMNMWRDFVKHIF